MPIPDYYVFGVITDKDSAVVDDVLVYAINIDVPGSPVYVTDTTGADGQYKINLSELSTISNGTNIEISCTDNSIHQSQTFSFELKLDQPFRNVDLQLEHQTSTYDIDTLLKKMNLENKNNKDVLLKQMNLDEDYDLDTLLKLNDIKEDYDLDIVLKRLHELKQFDVDTILKLMDISASELLNILIKILNEDIDMNLDTLIKIMGNTIDYDIDLLIKNLGLSTDESIDIILKNMNVTEDMGLDVLLKKIVSKSYNLDMISSLVVPLPFKFDTFIKMNDIDETKHDMDLLTKITESIHMFADILLKLYNVEVSSDIDTLLKKMNLLSDFNIDTILRLKYIESDYNLNTLLKRMCLEEPHILNVLLLKHDMDKSYILDIFLKIVKTTNYSIDGLFKSVGREKVRNDLDILFKLFGVKTFNDLEVHLRELDIDTSLSLDMIVVLVVRKMVLIDIILKRYGVKTGYNLGLTTTFYTHYIPYMLNAHLLKYGLTIKDNLDTYLSMLNIESGFNIDAYLIDEDVNRDISIEALLIKYNIDESEYNLDALFKILKLKKDYNIDILLKEMNINIGYNMQISLIFQRLSMMNLDVLTKKYNITNSAYYDLQTLKLNLMRQYGLDIRIGRNLMIWTIDTCPEWNTGTFVKNTECDDGDLVLVTY